ncbi:MAG: hypothetical protein ACK4MV_04360 [Beijerinckiaceae bacterium]
MYPISQKAWKHYRTSILDHELNVAVMVIANRLFPAGFDVSDDAPDSYEKLVQRFESGRRYVVYSGGADKTIFGDPEVNYCFRAWHDWCHWRGRFDFSFTGEYATYEMQCEHLVRVYGQGERIERWKKILFADVIGQRLHHDLTGTFPVDQMKFVREFLSRHSVQSVDGVPMTAAVTRSADAAE